MRIWTSWALALSISADPVADCGDKVSASSLVAIVSLPLSLIGMTALRMSWVEEDGWTGTWLLLRLSHSSSCCYLLLSDFASSLTWRLHCVASSLYSESEVSAVYIDRRQKR